MSCREFESRVALHAGGDLPQKEIARLESHLAGCPDCSRILLELQEIRRSLSRFPAVVQEESMLEEMRQGVMVALAHRPMHLSLRDKLRNAVFGWGIKWAAAMALSGTLAILVWITLSRTPPSRSPDSAGPGSSESSAVAPLPGALASSSLPNPIESTRLSGSRSPTQKPVESRANPTQSKKAHFAAKHQADKLLLNPALRRIELQTTDPNIRIIWFVGPPARGSGATGTS
jgi:anti-sigma factor RsiW